MQYFPQFDLADGSMPAELSPCGNGLNGFQSGSFDFESKSDFDRAFFCLFSLLVGSFRPTSSL